MWYTLPGTNVQGRQAEIIPRTKGGIPCPKLVLYRFLQVKHGFNAQFGEKALEWSEMSLLGKVVNAGTSKGLISDMYVHIGKIETGGGVDLPSKNKWQEDIRNITEEPHIDIGAQCVTVALADSISVIFGTQIILYPFKYVFVWKETRCQMPKMWQYKGRSYTHGLQVPKAIKILKWDHQHNKLSLWNISRC